VNREKATILITERNPHVREFLKREIAAEGYDVRLAENGREMLKCVYRKEPIDLLILDPDLPDPDVSYILMELQDRVPRIPVIFHTFPPDFTQYSSIMQDAVFVEKKGNSILELKQMVEALLKSGKSDRV
jgi:DNA-binding NtrC family response regulator